MGNSICYSKMGARIRNLRRDKNMTQERLAERAHISAAFCGHIERGSRKPSLETIAQIAYVLGAF